MDYQDRSIGFDGDALTIRGYYLPGTTKRIVKADIRSVARVAMSATRGRGRIWGTANPGYWANLDTHRASKTVAFLVDSGHRVKPYLTPDDPDGFEAALRGYGVEVTDSAQPGPIV